MKVNQFQPYLGQEEYEGIKSCFDENWITEGPKSEQFCNRLLALMGARYGVFAPNGTLALYLGLKAVGIGPGDEVIVPDLTFIASANAVEMCGATPIFVDVNASDLQIKISDCHELVTPNTKAIMPVHLFGLAVNMDEVSEFAKEHNLKIIEDAAQAVGVNWSGKHCGTWGDVGCFSFFADKTITTGEGGFVTTDNEEVYNKLLFLRNQGRKSRGSFVHPHIGYNFRITDIQAAIGLTQLDKLDDIFSKKAHLLKRYKEQLLPSEDFKILEPDSKSNHIPFRVVLLTHKPALPLMDTLKANDIETRTIFYPLHTQPCYANSGDDSQFKNSMHAYEHGLCLPSYPALEDAQIDYVCQVIRDYYDKNSVSR